jgi:hypothetical protein
MPSLRGQEPPDDPWAATPWGAVTASGILQARCGRPVGAPSKPCNAWRLSSPGGTRWRPCYACGSAEQPVSVEAAGPQRVAAAIASARRVVPTG